MNFDQVKVKLKTTKEDIGEDNVALDSNKMVSQKKIIYCDYFKIIKYNYT